MLKAIALDDEPLALEILSHYCERMADKVDLLGTFTKIMETKAFLEDHQVDLLFLDVKMPFLSGIEFYQLYGKERMLIFTTAFQDFALEGFNLNAVDYLMKPIEFERFQKAVDKALELKKLRETESQKTKPHTLSIKVDGKSVFLKLEEIHYIESMGDYLKIFREDAKFLITRMTIKNISELLPTSEFIQVHKSFFVAKSKVESLGPKSIRIVNREIPIGNTFKKLVAERFGEI